MGYEEALRAARVEQPVLQARELEVEALRSTAEAADELPDPRLRAGIVNLPVTGPAAFDLDRQLPTQVQVGVEQEIPNLAKRRARAGLAGSDIRLAEARLGVVGRDVEVAAGRAWISLAYAQQRLALAVEAQDELRKLVPVAHSAVASGSARPAESLEIRRALLEIDDARTRIEADRETAQARLTRYIARDEPVAQGAAPPVDVDLIELRRTLESNPGIILADTAEQRARAAIDLARAEKRPDFGVNVSFGRRNPDFGSVVSVMGSVTLPIFAGRRQEPRIAAAEAQAAAALAERADALRALEAQFEADLASWRSAARQWQRAREELLPLARDRADLEIASFAAGRAELIDVIEAKTALALLELEILEREEATVEAAAKLRLTYQEHMQ
ncbi:TolC family protein [Erythrobacter sp. 3-20A1M]|uniref:TolC family protein n=1 Tax=Erythrobacter sp. 3-20A1M TaxID=2653850 RepID=UPI00203B5AF0|nr:TolC family protein [Erythrobacter sp. 3-20A1M]